ASDEPSPRSQSRTAAATPAQAPTAGMAGGRCVAPHALRTRAAATRTVVARLRRITDTKREGSPHRGADPIRHREGNEREGSDADVSHPWLPNRSRRAQPGPRPAAVARP